MVAEKHLAQLLAALTQPTDTLYQWGLSPGIYFNSRRRAASGVVMTHILYFCPEDVQNKLKNKIYQSVTRSRPAFLLFNQWTGNFKEIMIYQALHNEYRYFGNYDKSVIYVRKDHVFDPKIAQRLAAGVVNRVAPGIRGGRLLLAADTPETEVFRHVQAPMNRRFLVAPGDSPDARRSREGNLLAQKSDWAGALGAWSQSRAPESEANLGTYFERSGSYFRAMTYYQIGYQKFGHPWDEYYQQVQWKLIYQAQYQPEKMQLAQHRRDLAQPVGDDEYARLIRQGNAEAERGRWYKARDIWLEAVRRFPAFPQAFANLGIFFEINCDYDSALAAYGRAAKEMGEPWLTYYQEVRKLKGTP